MSDPDSFPPADPDRVGAGRFFCILTPESL